MLMNKKTKMYLLASYSGIKLIIFTILMSILSFKIYQISGNSKTVALFIMLFLIILAIPIAFREYVLVQSKMEEIIRESE